MWPSELKQADARRVRWLCHASDEDVRQLCATASVTDSARIHCARFALHIVRGVPLPTGYAWDVLNASEYAKGSNAYLAPFEGHVCMMAFAAADLDATVDPVPFFTRDNLGVGRVAIRRFALSPRAVPDQRLVDLSQHESRDVRAAVARVLRWRGSPVRKQILLRLMDDPDRIVWSAAQNTAGYTQDPELLDVLAAKGNLCALNYCDDPRGRPRVDALIYSEDPLYHEWGIAFAARLGDRELLAHLWDHPEWDTRSNAILAAAWRGLLYPLDIEQVLATESIERKAELMLRWPTDEAGLLRCARAIKACVDEFPSGDALVAGRSCVLHVARRWITTNPTLAGAITRLVPHEMALLLVRELMTASQAEARIAGILVVLRRDIRECFPAVAELCLDEDENVAREAGEALYRGRAACGIYGLDTSVLAAGDDFKSSLGHEWELARMLSESFDV
jgi:hypothetical protein